MASHDDDRLDFNKLQKELDTAVEQDARYWRENSAKIRAVSEQRVATYEEFKDLVAASHLKPLNKGDNIEKINEISKHPWNPAASRNSSSNKSLTSVPQTVETNVKLPKTSQEFARDWQRAVKTKEERYYYLLSCGAPLLADLFKTEVNLLGDILDALTVFEENQIISVLNILVILKSSNRFSLSLQFLSKKEREICLSLFEKLSHYFEENGSDELKGKVLELKSVYLHS